MKKQFLNTILFLLIGSSVFLFVGCNSLGMNEEKVRDIVENFDPSEYDNISDAIFWGILPGEVEKISKDEYSVKGTVVYQSVEKSNLYGEAKFVSYVKKDHDGNWKVSEYRRLGDLSNWITMSYY